MGIVIWSVPGHRELRVDDWGVRWLLLQRGRYWPKERPSTVRLFLASLWGLERGHCGTRCRGEGEAVASCNAGMAEYFISHNFSGTWTGSVSPGASGNQRGSVHLASPVAYTAHLRERLTQVALQIYLGYPPIPHSHRPSIESHLLLPHSIRVHRSLCLRCTPGRPFFRVTPTWPPDLVWRGLGWCTNYLQDPPHLPPVAPRRRPQALLFQSSEVSAGE